MRMFFKSLSILLLFSLLIGGLVSCDMAGNTDDTATSVSLTPYSAVEYADLETVENPDGDTVTAITNVEATDAMFSALGGLNIIMDGLGKLEDDTTGTFVPRSITGTVALSVEDEHFAIEDSEGDITWLDLDIDYLDLTLSGGIHSLTGLIDSMLNDPEDPTAMFPADCEIGLSFKADIEGAVDTGSEVNDLLTSQSGYLSIALADLDSDADGNPSGTLNAKLKYSAAMNYLVKVNNDGPPSTYLVPVLCTISMKDINNADLATLGTAINNLNDSEAEPAISDIWNAIENSLWGASDTPCISISATYKDDNGTIQNLQQVKDEDVLDFIMQLQDS